MYQLTVDGTWDAGLASSGVHKRPGAESMHDLLRTVYNDLPTSPLPSVWTSTSLSVLTSNLGYNKFVSIA